EVVLPGVLTTPFRSRTPAPRVGSKPGQSPGTPPRAAIVGVRRGDPAFARKGTMSVTVRPDCSRSSSSSSSSSSSPDSADAFAGVDVAKDSLAACVLVGDQRRHDAVAPYTDEGVAALLADFAARGVKLVVCEATGGLERRLVVALLAAGLSVVVINPKQMRDF